MIGTTRGVVGLAVVAAGLGAALVATRPTPASTSRQLWPGFEPAAVERITITRADAPPLILRRGDAGWQVEAPAPGPVLPRVVPDLLEAFAGATWQRAVPSTAPAPDSVVLDLGVGAPWTIGPAEAGGLRRVARGGQAWLVDGWIAATADLRLADVRRRRAFPVELADAPSIEVHGAAGELVALDGARALVTPDGAIALDDVPRAALLAALAGVEAVDFPVGPPTPGAELVISVGPATAPLQLGLAPAGTAGCGGGQRRASSSIGELCVTDAVVAAVGAAIAPLQAPGSAWRRRALISAEPGVAEVVLPSGVALQQRGAAFRVVAAAALPADDDAARGVLALLTTARAAAPVPLPVRAPDATARVTERDGRVTTLQLWRAEALVARAGEPLADQLTVADLQRLDATLGSLRERVLWVDDPEAITGVSRGGRAVPLTAPVRAALAQPTAVTRGLSRPAGPPTATITIDVAAPPLVGAPARQHVLTLWTRGDGCVVELADPEQGPTARDVAQLAPATCAALRP